MKRAVVLLLMLSACEKVSDYKPLLSGPVSASYEKDLALCKDDANRRVEAASKNQLCKHGGGLVGSLIFKEIHPKTDCEVPGQTMVDICLQEKDYPVVRQLRL